MGVIEYDIVEQFDLRFVEQYRTFSGKIGLFRAIFYREDIKKPLRKGAFVIRIGFRLVL